MLGAPNTEIFRSCIFGLGEGTPCCPMFSHYVEHWEGKQWRNYKGTFCCCWVRKPSAVICHPLAAKSPLVRYHILIKKVCNIWQPWLSKKVQLKQSGVSMCLSLAGSSPMSYSWGRLVAFLLLPSQFNSKHEEESSWLTRPRILLLEPSIWSLWPQLLSADESLHYTGQVLQCCHMSH